MNTVFLKLLGMAGGRTWIVGWVAGVVLPFVPDYVNPANVTEVVGGIVAIAISVIVGQSYKDGKSGGATSTSAMVLKNGK